MSGAGVSAKAQGPERALCGNALVPPAPPNLEALAAARVVRIERGIIRHPSYMNAQTALEEMLARAKVRRHHPGLKARARLLYGVTGAGKSTLIEQFKNNHPDEHSEDGVIRRVVVVETPEATTKRELAVAILRELGYLTSARANASSIVQDIADKARRLHIELIIMDEAHHIMSSASPTRVGEFLKSLLNRIGCDIVLAGLPELIDIHQHGQLDRRLAPDAPLLLYDWMTPAGRLEFIALMAEFERLVDLPHPSNLADQDFAMRFYAASGGAAGLVSNLLSEAVKVATREGRTAIDKPLMAAVYARFTAQETAPQAINLAADLHVPEASSWQDMADQLRAPRIDPRTNPFVCETALCGTIWKDRWAALHRPSRLRRVSPHGARLTRGQGAKTPDAF